MRMSRKAKNARKRSMVALYGNAVPFLAARDHE